MLVVASRGGGRGVVEGEKIDSIGNSLLASIQKGESLRNGGLFTTTKRGQQSDSAPSSLSQPQAGGVCVPIRAQDSRDEDHHSQVAATNLALSTQERTTDRPPILAQLYVGPLSPSNEEALEEGSHIMSLAEQKKEEEKISFLGGSDTKPH